ncbi:MAG: serine/threonine protein kinase [Planctomycetota bacterium]|nr:MAG: serine/threonine protein kinase [Planctomycetota bacterium]REJ94514.1 MAG: serine/threonine protein kinase [Planctomycetota bacterium]REK18624.1 MAG: serine/threonine protein kinase [Planctomycetota bacterium]REK37520.1 MAG: serine/threonine protein kinase [Planctomycetota bacterium]
MNDSNPGHGDAGEYPSDRRLAETASLPLASGADTWDALVPYMETFIDRWENGGEPALAEHLPTGNAVLRKLALAELVKIDLEYRYRGDHPKRRLDAYLAEFAELGDGGGPPADLIFEEFHLRREAGEEASAEEYLERYPQRAAELEQLLAMDTGQATVSRARQAAVDVQPGETLGDFEVILLLGKGAFGSVFLARQTSLQRLVALKVSADHGAEPQTLAQLDHPNIVRVYDQLELADRKLRMMYLQFVPGGTLEVLVKLARQTEPSQRNGRLVCEVVAEQLARNGGLIELDAATRERLQAASWPELVCRWGAELAEALEYAHRQGVLHRDIKPANVLIAADGTPKLADFNVSFSAGVAGDSADAFFGGSLAYMSPEHLDAFDPGHRTQPEELDGRADVYSLAVLLWELLDGERPFANEVVVDDWSKTIERLRLARQQGVAAESIGSAEAIVRRVARVLARCLSPRREDRFASAGELAEALALCPQERAAGILERPFRGTRRWYARHAILAVVLAVLVPNLAAGIFNLIYNWQEIIRPLPEARDLFFGVQTAINLIAFPLGIGMIVWWMWPLARCLRARTDMLSNGDNADRQELSEQRRDTFHLGRFAAATIVGLWAVAGLAYPVALHYGGVDMDATRYLHFLASLVYCGLVAAVYPLLLVTALSLRVFFPGLLDGLTISEQERSDFDALARRAGVAVVLAGALPALGILALVLTSLFTQSQSVMAQLVLSIAGVVGFGLAFALYRVIQQDLSALSGALRSSTS